MVWLLTIPGALGVLSGLLALSAVVEERVLSPRSLIRSAVRSRRAKPEFTEAFVTKEFERLLKDAQG